MEITNWLTKKLNITKLFWIWNLRMLFKRNPIESHSRASSIKDFMKYLWILWFSLKIVVFYAGYYCLVEDSFGFKNIFFFLVIEHCYMVTTNPLMIVWWLFEKLHIFLVTDGLFNDSPIILERITSSSLLKMVFRLFEDSWYYLRSSKLTRITIPIFWYRSFRMVNNATFYFVSFLLLLST